MNMLDTTFKPASLSDIEILLTMMRQFYIHEELPLAETAARKALEGILTNEAFGRVFLILSGEMIAGYVVLTFGYSLEFHGRDAFVDELFLNEQFRGKGLGGRVLEFLAEVCRENSVKALHLEVARKNLAAQIVYQKFGFENHDGYLMTKLLNAN